MKRICLILLSLPAILPLQAYNDHRGHNLDSLERVVAKWTPDAVDRASEQELLDLNRAYRDLMLGYSVLNGEKCIFYARKALSISQPRAWKEADADAYRYIGQHYYGQEQYDSALFYYQAALACVNQMEAGATSPLRPEGYTQLDVDDEKSALYGTIGNLYRGRKGDFGEILWDCRLTGILCRGGSALPFQTILRFADPIYQRYFAES